MESDILYGILITSFKQFSDSKCSQIFSLTSHPWLLGSKDVFCSNIKIACSSSVHSYQPLGTTNTDEQGPRWALIWLLHVPNRNLLMWTVKTWSVWADLRALRQIRVFALRTCLFRYAATNFYICTFLYSDLYETEKGLAL